MSRRSDMRPDRSVSHIYDIEVGGGNVTDFLIDVGNQGHHTSHNFNHAKGCWRQLSRGSCDRKPNPHSPSGMCTWHWLEWTDDDVWQETA